MNLTDKKNIAEEMHAIFAESKIVIVADYKGLDVEAMTRLRRELRETGSELRVVKNSLLRRASEGTDVAVAADLFKGPTAVAFSTTDPVAPAKVMHEFAEKNDKLELRAGAMGGKVLDLEEIKALSSLPSREVLLAQVLAAMNAVPQTFVRTLAEVPKSLLNVLVAVKDKKDVA